MRRCFADDSADLRKHVSLFQHACVTGFVWLAKLCTDYASCLCAPNMYMQPRAVLDAVAWQCKAVPLHAVVFLDADTIVVNNMDEAFKCPGFCAALRHSERFNSGVMVITPSEATFKGMMDSIQSTDSYTGYARWFSDCVWTQGLAVATTRTKFEQTGP